MKKTILLILAACLLMASCSKTTSQSAENSIYYAYDPEDTVDNVFYWELLHIDSIRAEYEHNLVEYDTTVIKGLKLNYEDTKEAEAEKYYAEVRSAWFKLLELCAQRRFEEASQVYLQHEPDYLTVLGTSTTKFELDYFVGGLLLLYHYPEYDAWEKITKIIEGDKLIAETVIMMGEGRSGHVPPQYPFLISFLGQAYVAIGEKEKAMGLVEPYRNALNLVIDDQEYIENNVATFEQDIQSYKTFKP